MGTERPEETVSTKIKRQRTVTDQGLHRTRMLRNLDVLIFRVNTVHAFADNSWKLSWNRSEKSYVWVAPCENMSSSMRGQRRPRSDCAFVQSNLGLPCPQTESLDTTECMSGEQRPG